MVVEVHLYKHQKISLFSSGKHVVIFGSDGMAGTAIKHCLVSSGYTVLEYSRAVFDIIHSPFSKINLTGIDLVINASGMINRRQRHPGFAEQARLVNTEFPLRLASLCMKEQIPLIHISTDCVFDGLEGKYKEDAQASAKDVYGETKYLGEAENAMVIRLSMVGPEKKNYYSLLCWFLRQDELCNGFTDHHWNGLTTLQLGKVIKNIFEKDLYKEGIFHIYADDVSKYDLLCLFKKHFKKNIEIHPVNSTRSRDMRLRTNHQDLLEALAIPTLDMQIAEIVRHCDRAGHWINEFKES